jgi:hypothetical protein
VTALLHGHRREIGTRAGRRAGTVRTQAKLVLCWFRDDAPIRLLAVEAGLPISISYRYLHPAIDVIAEQASDLHEVLERAKREGWSHLTLDGTLIEIDRVNERAEAGHHLWYSGKHKTQGGNLQILADPGGFPVWSSEVEPGSVHDVTAARAHCLGALYKAAADGVSTLTDKGSRTPNSKNAGGVFGESDCARAELARLLPPQSSYQLSRGETTEKTSME